MTQQPQHEHVWGYEQAQGPSHWGELKAEFAACKTGHRQSPIDIGESRKADLPAVEFDYKPSPLHICLSPIIVWHGMNAGLARQQVFYPAVA